MVLNKQDTQMENKKNYIGFWRRLAALWIDVFVIYSITKFLIVLISLIEFRISFGTLFIILGALYSTIMLSVQRQTIGKMLMRIIVTSESDDPVNLKYILLREVFGKWGTTIVMPMMLGLFLVGNNWLPTIFDILIMFPIALLCIIYFMFTKHMWYEHLAGLTVKRDLSSQKTKIGLYGLIFATILGVGTSLTEYLTKDRLPCHMSAYQDIRSTKPYVKFLNEQKTTPVDYVLGLFDKYDVVVLCERSHPEMTQWDFIFDVISDPRFISKNGHVFTEYGQVGMQEYLNKFMLTDNLNGTEVNEHAIHIMRNMAVSPFWPNYNWYKYLTRLYFLNQKLPPEKRVQHHFTDAEVDWSSIKTHKDYVAYENKFLVRDEIMAKTIIKEMSRLSKSSVKPQKSLVIMNYRHAMDLTDRLPDVKRSNTYEFLKDSFGDRAANVLINDRILRIAPIASGLWDDAFEKIGNKPVGFNFQGSPFGASYFDLFPFDLLLLPLRNDISVPTINGSLRYRDVFTGFVYTHPLKDQYFQHNPPGFYKAFENESLNKAFEIEWLKSKDTGYIERAVDSEFETKIELFFSCFTGIGFLIGLSAFIFRRRKMIEEVNNI